MAFVLQAVAMFNSFAKGAYALVVRVATSERTAKNVATVWATISATSLVVAAAFMSLVRATVARTPLKPTKLVLASVSAGLLLLVFGGTRLAISLFGSAKPVMEGIAVTEMPVVVSPVVNSPFNSQQDTPRDEAVKAVAYEKKVAEPATKWNFDKIEETKVAEKLPLITLKTERAITSEGADTIDVAVADKFSKNQITELAIRAAEGHDFACVQIFQMGRYVGYVCVKNGSLYKHQGDWKWLAQLPQQDF